MAERLSRLIVLLLLVAAIGGCGDPTATQIAQLQENTRQKLAQLADKLDAGQIRNSQILTEYAGLLKQQRPELTSLLDQLALDGTARGSLYRGLEDRVREAQDAANFLTPEEQLEELSNLQQALDPTLFGDALSDPINVMADMSDGKLARVNAISQAQSQLANQSENFGPGAQLIGNPNYGQWQTGSNGLSFWEWYGMYALFSNLFDSRISYDRWGRYRNYSYYNDYGRYRYSSPKQRRKQQQTWNKTTKKFSTGNRYQSPYSKSRAGSSKLSTNSMQAKTAAGTGFGGDRSKRFNSTSRTKSSYANNSSFRNSRSSTSRGVRRGK